MKRSTAIIILFLLILQACNYNEETQNIFYVSPSGSDNNQGTKTKPFASIFKARDVIRSIPRDSMKEKITVFIEPGVYKIDSTFRLQEEDSGSDSTHKITYKALVEGEVYFTGGESINPEKIKPIEGSPLEDVFKLGVKNKLRCINLKELGIHNYGKMKQQGFSIAILPTALELFIDDLAMHPARWPNDSTVPITDVIDTGSIPRKDDFSNKGGRIKYDYEQPEKWKYTDNIWAGGIFAWGYADDNIRIKEIDTTNNTIAFKQVHLYGIESSKDDDWGAEHRRIYFYNIPEELDKPGEYYIDRENGYVYFYPPKNDDINKVQLSTLESPLFSCINASNISFEGFTFECSRGMAVYIEKGERVELKNCIIRNMGTLAVSLGQGVKGTELPVHNFTGQPASETVGNIKAHLYDNTTWNRKAGHHHLISGCKIYQTGSGGISLSGGDRLTLSPGNNVVRDCEIYNFNRITETYAPALHVTGVGNKVVNCNIHDAPNMGIAIFGNNHIIDSCIFERLCMNANDMGAILISRDVTERGNIIQNSFFNEIGVSDEQSVTAIYLDAINAGTTIRNNVFRKSGKGWFAATFLNHSLDCPVYGNLFIDTKFACKMEYILETKEWIDKHLAPGGLYYVRTNAVNYKNDPWKSAYPQLADVFQEIYTPQRNPFYNNVIIRSKVILSETGIKAEDVAYNNITLDDNTDNPEKRIEEIQIWIEKTGINKVLNNAGTNFDYLLNSTN